MSVFGPVPSRRLGSSLGINNIPPKICSYSCTYCQVGRTNRMQIDRQPFADPETLVQSVVSKVEAARALDVKIDYLAFVPDGEPTLDANLGREIDLLRPLGLPVAVISNGSLLWREDVRRDLARADWVSLKVDAVDETTWRQLDRPHGQLRLEATLAGMLAFAGSFAGELVTETMLVRGINDVEAQLERVAGFLGRLRPARAYLSVPTRPPAETSVLPPEAESIRRAQLILASSGVAVECLTGSEGNAFVATGDAREDLLAILAVHPMREEAVRLFLARARAAPAILDEVLATGQVVANVYQGETYYRPRLPRAGVEKVEGSSRAI